MIDFARRVAATRLVLLLLAQSIVLLATHAAVTDVLKFGVGDTRFHAAVLMLAAGLALFWPAVRTTRPLAFQLVFWRWLGVGSVAIAVALILQLGGRDDARNWFLAAAAGWTATLTAALALLPYGFIHHRALRAIDLLATNAAVILVLAELSLRAIGTCTGQHRLPNEQLDGYRLQPNRNYGDLLHTNGHGYASREFVREKRPGVRRIAALGDSFALGVVRQDLNYLQLLESRVPDCEVYNFGVGGTGPREYDQLLRDEVWSWEPDLVLVSVFVGNDVLGWWRLPSSDRLDPMAFRLYVLTERAWRLGRERLRRSAESYSAAAIWQPLEFQPLSRRSHLEHEFSRLSICRYSETVKNERAWNRTFLWLESTVAQCKQRGVPLAVVLVPDEFQVNQELLVETLEFRGVPAEDVDVTLPQRRLKQFYADRGVPCLDLMPHFDGVPGTYKPRDTHWNEKGNQLAAEVIAEWLRTQAPFHGP